MTDYKEWHKKLYEMTEELVDAVKERFPQVQCERNNEYEARVRTIISRLVEEVEGKEMIARVEEYAR